MPPCEPDLPDLLSCAGATSCCLDACGECRWARGSSAIPTVSKYMKKHERQRRYAKINVRFLRGNFIEEALYNFSDEKKDLISSRGCMCGDKFEFPQNICQLSCREDRSPHVVDKGFKWHWLWRKGVDLYLDQRSKAIPHNKTVPSTSLSPIAGVKKLTGASCPHLFVANTSFSSSVSKKVCGKRYFSVHITWETHKNARIGN